MPASNRLRALLGRFHLLAAVFPVLFLPAVLVKAWSFDFVPKVGSYGTYRMDAATSVEAIRQGWKSRHQDPHTRVVAIWGAGRDEGARKRPFAEEIGQLFVTAGCRVRIADPAPLDDLEIPEAFRTIDPLAAVRGATDLVIVDDLEEYVHADFGKVRAAMADRYIVDCTGHLRKKKVQEEHGFVVFPLFNRKSPPWLDPTFQHYSAKIEKRIPPEDAVLLLPSEGLVTDNPRARWYLHLNYRLYPRRLFIPEPELANGTAEQYQDWVQEMNQIGPELLAGRRELAEEVGAKWILLFRHVLNFRGRNYELQRLTPTGTETVPR